MKLEFWERALLWLFAIAIVVCYINNTLQIIKQTQHIKKQSITLKEFTDWYINNMEVYAETYDEINEE